MRTIIIAVAFLALMTLPAQAEEKKSAVSLSIKLAGSARLLPTVGFSHRLGLVAGFKGFSLGLVASFPANGLTPVSLLTELGFGKRIADTRFGAGIALNHLFTPTTGSHILGGGPGLTFRVAPRLILGVAGGAGTVLGKGGLLVFTAISAVVPIF